MQLPKGEYWMYLRKSRADLEAEARGEGETLAKHRKALFALAKQHHISVTEIYAETASGENIIHRPEMLRLLQDLESSPPAGVLVMDIDRFGRGDKIDQGLIERAFKESNALIVTPAEVFDMNNEAGEFNVEVRSFLARMELKQITKRMQGGRRRSVEDGNYLGTRPPYGYDLHTDNIGRTLKPNLEQAEIVKLIFALYTHDDPKERAGSSKIATKLNEMNVKTYTGKPWEPSTVLGIIKNEVYLGRIQWGKKKTIKSKVSGQGKEVEARPREQWIDIKGRHEPLISESVFSKAKKILEKKYHLPYQLINGITNPLAGLIRCADCGASMVYRPYVNSESYIMCAYKGCPNRSSKLRYIEEAVFDGMIAWMADYRDKWLVTKPDITEVDQEQIKLKAIKDNQKNIAELTVQKNNLHDLLERGIYDESTFLARSKDISDRILAAEQVILELEHELMIDKKRNVARNDVLPKMESAIKLYRETDDPAEQNAILKSVLDYCLYKKEKSQRNADFSLIIMPHFPD